MKKSILSCILGLAANYVSAQTITTVAGTGTAGFSGDNGSAVTAELSNPNSVAFDGAGNLYFVDAGNRRIRKVSTSGIISEVAGNGVAAYMGDNGPATAAELDYPDGIAVDSAGDVFISCDGDNRIRKVNTSGIITTLAGTGSSGYNGDNIPATSAQLFYPYVGFADKYGNLYFSDWGNHRVRKIDTAGIITTIAGNGTAASSGDGLPATAASLNGPGWLTISQSGEMYIPDDIGANIRKIDAAGIISTIAGTGSIGSTGDGGPATDATFSYPNSVVVDDTGNIYIADYGAYVIRKINTSGIISTFAGTDTAGYGGDGGPASSATFDSPNDLAFDAAGNLYVADPYNNRIRKITFTPTEGIKNTQAPSSNIAIYPNPARQSITLASAQTLPVAEVRIVDVVGQQVFVQTYTAFTRTDINVSSLPAGVYLVKVNGVYAGKVVKE